MQYYLIAFDGSFILFNNSENDFQIKETKLIKERTELEYVINAKSIEKDNRAISDRIDSNRAIYDKASSDRDVPSRPEIIFPRKLYNKISNIIKKVELTRENQFGKEFEKKYKQTILERPEVISSSNEFKKE